MSKIKVYGRNLLRDTRIDLSDVDDVVFDFGNHRSVRVSLYRARIHDTVDISSDDSCVAVYPQAANSICVKPERH